MSGNRHSMFSVAQAQTVGIVIDSSVLVHALHASCQRVILKTCPDSERLSPLGVPPSCFAPPASLTCSVRWPPHSPPCLCSCFDNILFPKNPHPRTCLLALEQEEGRRRERETWCEGETSIGCLPYVPWSETEPSTFCWDDVPTNWAASQGSTVYSLKKLFKIKA